MARFERLRWNPNNTGHILRDDVRVSEEVEVIRGDGLVEPSSGGLLLAIGKTAAGRVLAVILDPETGDGYLPATARPVSRRERERYGAVREEKWP